MLKKVSLFLSFVILFNLSYAEEPKINLRLPKITNEDRSTLGLSLLVSGLALTAGAILEGDESYTTNYYYNSSGQLVRDVKPFMEQTPRQFLLFTGAALTVTGIYITIDDLKFRFR